MTIARQRLGKHVPEITLSAIEETSTATQRLANTHIR
jgi:hypothetical protein